MSRDVMALIVKSPWWVVVGLVSGGFVWASNIQGEVREVHAALEDGRSAPVIRIERKLDSLTIETRHQGETLTEIRHLLGRSSPYSRLQPPRDPFHPARPR